MDPQLRKAIQDVKEKRNHSDSTIDSVELEKCLREFKTELYIKRDEVNQLRAELDAVNVEMQNQKKVLDATKKALDENQFNLSLQLKKARNNEEELQEKRESLMKIQLQHKMAMAEVDTLKENLQKTEKERIELSRKVDVFEAKQRHNSVYHDEILKRDGYLRSFMQKVNEMYTRLQAEHAEAIDLSKKTQIAAEALEKLRIYVRENEKLKKEKEKFEEMYIKVNAKYEKLEQLLGTNSSVNNPNLLTKIVFNQWKLNTAHCEAQTQQRNEILNKVTEHFTAEKTTNVKLIQENEHIKEIKKQLEEDNLKLKERCQENLAIIASLKTKIKMLEDARSQNPTRPEGGIKDEPIEIGD